MTAERKHFDVTPPGRTPVSHTSRPIIAGRSDMVRDPMMREDGQLSDENAAALAKHTEINVSPPTENSDASSSADTMQEPVKQTDLLSGDKPIVAENNESSMMVSTFDEDKPSEAKANKAPAQQKDEANDHVKQLIEGKAYHLPIRHGAHRSTAKVVAIVVVSLMIIVVMAFVAMTQFGS